MNTKFEQNMIDAFDLPVEGELVETKKKINYEEKQIDDDYQYARRNLRDVIDHAKLAIDELHNIASQTEAPRAYEVYSALVKTTVEANKDLLELKEKHKRIREGEKTSSPQITNNSLFVGTTSELFKLIKDQNG